MKTLPGWSNQRCSAGLGGEEVTWTSWSATWLEPTRRPIKGETDPHHQRGDAPPQSAPSRPQALSPLPKFTLLLDPAPRPGAFILSSRISGRLLACGPRWSGLGALGRRLALARSAACCSRTGGPHAKALAAGACLGGAALGPTASAGGHRDCSCLGIPASLFGVPEA